MSFEDEDSRPIVKIFPCLRLSGAAFAGSARCMMRTEVIEDENDDGVKEERKRRRKVEEGEV